jgi:hypothetical protein
MSFALFVITSLVSVSARTSVFYMAVRAQQLWILLLAPFRFLVIGRSELVGSIDFERVQARVHAAFKRLS